MQNRLPHQPELRPANAHRENEAEIDKSTQIDAIDATARLADTVAALELASFDGLGGPEAESLLRKAREKLAEACRRAWPDGARASAQS